MHDLPGCLEGAADREHQDKHTSLVAADHAVPEPGLHEGKQAQAKPADTGYQAVGVAAPPEAERAPPTRGQRSRALQRQLGSWIGQERSEVQRADRHRKKDDNGQAPAGQEPVDEALELGVGRQGWR